MKDPPTGRWADDIHLLIEDIEWLDDAERDQVFAGNAQQLFKLRASRSARRRAGKHTLDNCIYWNIQGV